jgi:DNA-binding NarL/FixJ family response regulator
MNTERASLKVYLVDDTRSVRERVAERLRGIDGVEIVGEAATPAAATAGILRAHPHAVLLDLRLQDGSGLEVLKSVHPLNPDIVFIVLTNHAEPAYHSRCVQLGASYFLDKTHHFEMVAKIISGLSQRLH